MFLFCLIYMVVKVVVFLFIFTKFYVGLNLFIYYIAFYFRWWIKNAALTQSKIIKRTFARPKLSCANVAYSIKINEIYYACVYFRNDLLNRPWPRCAKQPLSASNRFLYAVRSTAMANDAAHRLIQISC